VTVQLCGKLVSKTGAVTLPGQSVNVFGCSHIKDLKDELREFLAVMVETIIISCYIFHHSFHHQSPT